MSLESEIALTSSAQRRLWFQHKVNPESPAYTIPVALELEGTLDVEAVRDAFISISRRHEILRTTFASEEGTPWQVIHDELPVSFQVLETDLHKRDALLREIIGEPFDLIQGPLWRIRLLRLGASSHILVLTIHHIAADAWSIGVILDEFSRLYCANSVGSSIDLPELELQFADFAEWEDDRLAGSELESQVSYWKDVLGQLPSPMRLPGDRDRPKVFSERGQIYPKFMSQEHLAAIDIRAAADGETRFSVLLAGYLLFMHHLTSQEEIVIGVPVAGRYSSELEGMIGLFVNTVPVRSSLHPQTMVGEFLSQTQKTLRSALDHQELPIDRIIEAVAAPRDRSRSPLFQTLFALQNSPLAELSLPGVEMKILDLAGEGAKFDLTLSAEERDGGLRFSWEYYLDCYDEARVQTWADAYQTLLERIADTADSSVENLLASLPVLERAEAGEGDFPSVETARTSSQIPLSPSETILHRLWAKVIGISPESVDDNFFELGGDSILAVQIADLAKREGLELEIGEFFEYQTIRTLAAQADANVVDDSQAGSALEPFALSPLPAQALTARYCPGLPLMDAFPLTPMQSGMAFHSLYDGDAASNYTEQVLIHLEGELDLKRFRYAWDEVLKWFPNLGGLVAWDDMDEPLLLVPAKVSMPFEALDWSELGEREFADRLEHLLAEDRRRGFDLGEPPLMRVTVIKGSANRLSWIWTHHHLLLDGWSLPIIFNLLRNVYVSGSAASHPEETIPFRTFVNWIRQRDTEAAKEFWSSYLNGIETATVLPLCADTSPVNEIAATGPDNLRFALGADEVENLNEFCRRSQVTLSTLVQAAWAKVLSLHSSDRRVCFGLTVSGRPPELEGAQQTPGLFINTVPVVVEQPASGNLASWLRDLQGQQAILNQFHWCALYDVQRWSQLEDSGRLFDSLIVFENYPQDPSILNPEDGFKVTDIQMYEQTNFPLTIGVIPGAEMEFDFLFDPKRWCRDQIEDIFTQLKCLLFAAVTDPDIQLTRWSPISQDQRHQLLGPWSCGDRYEGTEGLLHADFEAWVDRDPQAVALFHGDIRISYGDLDRKANRIARVLRAEHDIRGEKMVAVRLEDPADRIIAFLAILKAGGVYVAIDPALPEGRVNWILNDCQPELLIDCDWWESLDGGASDDRLADRPGHEQLAYLIYTSGSTGTPKAVMVPHGGVRNMLEGKRRSYPLEAGERVIQLASPSFDASIVEIFISLGSGATLVLPLVGETLVGDDLLEFLEHQRISFAILPPSSASTLEIRELPDLNYLLFAGEKCELSLVQAWQRQGRLIGNNYGPTEISVCATVAICGAEIRGVSIGRPLPNVQVYLLSPSLEPVPPGVAGELFIGGSGVTRGYLNQAGLTAAAYVPDPFSQEPGARLYRSGDIGLWGSDDQIVFLRRRDEQVKLRGYRIELGEIESRLDSIAAVETAVVGIREKQLVAWYIPADLQNPIDADQMRNLLAEDLPGYMVPHVFVCLEGLPRTASGKLDRNSLHLPDTLDREPGSASVAARNSREEILCRIWSEVLHVKDVGIDDDYFRLGGDSILCMQMIAQARRHGFSFRPRDLFENPMISQLAPRCEEVSGHLRSAAAFDGKIPLGPIQHWFFEQELEFPHHWNQALLFRIKRHVEPEVLRAALQELQQHHPALTLRFQRTEAGWQQTYGDVSQAVAFESHDCPALGESDFQEKLESDASRLQSTLELEGGPIWRAALFERGDGEKQCLFVAVHHLAIDGVSWRVLLEDLTRILTDTADSEPVAASYAEWTTYLNELSRSDFLQGAKIYWQEFLQKVEELDDVLPSSPSPLANRVRSERVVIDQALTEKLLRELPRECRVSVQELLLAALSHTLTDWNSGAAVAINLEGHGRFVPGDKQAPDVGQTVGWFTSIYPFLLAVPKPDATLLATIEEVREALEAVPHQGTTWGILRYLDPHPALRDLSINCQPKISFNYLGQNIQQSEGALFELEPETYGAGQSPESVRPHVWDVSAFITNGCLYIDWIYDSELHAASLIQELLEDIRRQLQCVAEDLGRPVTPPPTENLLTDDLTAAELDSILNEIHEV